jgi:hypothetical protein
MAETLHEWHDFYLLIGTASATLVGLMFVAASIGASFFTAEREAGMRAFLTPTVLHFTAVLGTCVVMTVPALAVEALSALWLGIACIGVAYAARVWHQLRRGGFNIDLADRLWYATAPIASYLLMVAAAILLLLRQAAALDLLASSVVLLLLLGIRNAWDMTVWMTLRAPTAK